MRVLIAEDSAVERIMLRRYVQQLGHECEVAQNGAQAWQMFQANGADVLISDWMMPELDGPELCRRVRAHPGTPYTYVILLTVLDDQEHSRHGMHAGADDYLRKPLQIDELELRLIAAERINQLHRQLWLRETRRERTHEVLWRLTQRIAGQSNVEQLLAVLVTEATLLLGGTVGMASLWDEQQDCLVPTRSAVPEATATAVEQLSARAAQRRAPVISNNAPGEPDAAAAVAVPLLYDDLLLGALAVVSVGAARRFTPDDAQVLGRLAGIGSAGLVGLKRSRSEPLIEHDGPTLRFVLPQPPTSLIGRNAELEQLLAELQKPTSRLLTLTGPAGVGKTRLALAAAARVANALADGAAFVDLAAVRTPGLVLAAIAQALHVGAEVHLSGLQHALAGRQLVLVLDNFEHVLDAAADVAALLAACPAVKALVTSRAPLRLQGEQLIAVAPLAVPDLAQSRSLDAVSRSPAVALFVQRARAALAGFSLTEENAAPVAEICARLDGLPLAIELAAARIVVLAPEAMRMRIEHPLGLLTTSERDRPERHQTLRGAISWSYLLLQDEAQSLFRQLAVFPSDFSLEAAAAVWHIASGPAQSLDHQLLVDAISSLVDNSLMYRVAPEGEAARFRMLDTIREYARQELDTSHDREGARRRHAEFFATLVEDAAPALRASHQAVWLQRLDREYASLQAALQWAVDNRDARVGLRLAAALSGFWQLRGHLGEGSLWLERVLGLLPGAADAVRAQALSGVTRMAIGRRDWLAAVEPGEASVAAWRAQPAGTGLAEALADLAIVRSGQGTRSREPRALARESAALAHALGARWTSSYVEHCLGWLDLGQGNHAAAQAHFRESLDLASQVGDHWRAAVALEGMALVAAVTHRSERALRLSGAAARLREALHAPLDPAAQEWFDRKLAAARAELGEQRVASAWAEAYALSLQDIIASEAESDSDAVASPDSLALAEALNWLSPREREVTILVARGLHNYEIGDRLGITRHTVEIHVSNSLAKLGMTSRAQLAAWAASHGLLA